MQKIKKCSDCAEEKPLKEFYKHKSKRRGTISYCKGCASIRGRHFKMMSRCYNPQDPAFKNYGGRGIDVEKYLHPLKNYKTFIQKHLGPKPGRNYSIDRIDNSKGYYRNNMRWATTKEQSHNSRAAKWINGMTYADKSRQLGGTPALISKRLKDGWTLEDAASIPLGGLPSRRKKTPVIAIEYATGEDLFKFGSIKEAAKVCQVHGTNISKVLNGVQKQTKGWFFRRVEI